MSFDVGNYPVSTMFSYERVANGKPHTVTMVIQQKNFTMTIDRNNLARTIVNEGARTHLDLHDALYLGGLPSAINAQAFKKWHIRDGTSFRGLSTSCLLHVYFMSTSRLLHVYFMSTSCLLHSLTQYKPEVLEVCLLHACLVHSMTQYKLKEI